MKRKVETFCLCFLSGVTMLNMQYLLTTVNNVGSTTLLQSCFQQYCNKLMIFRRVYSAALHSQKLWACCMYITGRKQRFAAHFTVSKYETNNTVEPESGVTMPNIIVDNCEQSGQQSIVQSLSQQYCNKLFVFCCVQNWLGWMAISRRPTRYVMLYPL